MQCVGVCVCAHACACARACACACTCAYVNQKALIRADLNTVRQKYEAVMWLSRFTFDQ